MADDRAAHVVEAAFTVANERGLHARPAARLVQTALSFDSEVLLEKEGVEVNGKSILGVLMLCAAMGSRVAVRATGDDAEEAVAAVGKHLEAVHEY